MKDSDVNESKVAESHDLETNLAELLAFLKTSNKGSLHLFNTGLSPENGYLEVAVSRDPEVIAAWNQRFSDPTDVNYCRVPLTQMVKVFSEQSLPIVELTSSERFSELVGYPSRLYKAVEEPLYFFLSDTTFTLIRHGDDWDELEELYGTYLRPTKH